MQGPHGRSISKVLWRPGRQATPASYGEYRGVSWGAGMPSCAHDMPSCDEQRALRKPGATGTWTWQGPVRSVGLRLWRVWQEGRGSACIGAMPCPGLAWAGHSMCKLRVREYGCNDLSKAEG